MGIEDLKSFKDEVATPDELRELEGQKANIASVEEREVPSRYAERGKGHVVRVEVEAVTTKSGVEVRASELFNLKEDDAGKAIGWSEQGKLQQLLNRCGVEHPKDLVGKQITLKTRTKELDNGEKRVYLGFITD